MRGDQKHEMGSYGNVTGERGRDQGTQAACHSREFGPESSRRQGGSAHGRTYSDVSSGSVGGPWKRAWRGKRNTGRLLGAGTAHAETLGSFMGLVGGSGVHGLFLSLRGPPQRRCRVWVWERGDLCSCSRSRGVWSSVGLLS